MRRYSIWGQEYGADHEVELAQVENDPQPILDALAAKKLSVNHSAFPGGKKTKVRKFTWLRIVDNTK
jgi:hypothetical protein